ncbi:hypothetical protein [Skermania piniformis]|uniref:MalT-like winged helix domain-containing protein n=1 Tax=Skermania pinensis TaxID=39122 RepID=A0ABX8S504_9ACTN|nr:hypothetical protein [Skermania piniformis]QXQ12925.1 hypothetical protein KV203_13505 [Skermania piniformis]
MLIRDELTEIGEEQLRFDLGEAQEFVRTHGGPDLAADDLAKLTESTEGWAAALQLASLSMRGGGTAPTSLIARITGRHQALGDFLAENVLDALEPATLRFLMATSVPERISGELADALTESRGGEERLREIAQRGLFLRGVDENGDWYRYHHLFAEFLGRRLARDRPEDLPALRHRAAAWFIEHDMVKEAVDHLVAAGDDDGALDLVEDRGTSLLENGQMAMFAALAGALPAAAGLARPRLQILLAMANTILRRADATRTALDRALGALARLDLPPAEAERIRVQADVLRAVTEVYRDRADDVAALVAKPLADDSEPYSNWVRPVASVAAAFASLYRFDFAATRRHREHFDATAGGAMSTMYADCFAGLAAYEQLDVDSAEAILRRAHDTAQATSGPQSTAAALAGATLGVLRYERGDLAAAGRLLDVAGRIVRDLGVVDLLIAVYVYGARVKSFEDPSAAAAQLAEGADVAAASGLRRLQAAVVGERIRYRLTSGMPLTSRMSPSTLPMPSGGTGEVTAQSEEANAVRLLLAEGRDARARASELVTRVARDDRPRARLTADLLLGEALARHGGDAAEAHVIATVATCAEHGLIRPPLDEGPAMHEVVTGLLARHQSGQPVTGWQRIRPGYLTALAAASPRQPYHAGGAVIT